MSDKIKTGNKGENMAADFLKAKGFDIVARNYRFKHAEIDLIAQRDNWMIFVEVKTRSSVSFGQPEDFVDEAKARRIFEAAEEYIFTKNWTGHIRFDIVSVTMGLSPDVIHFEDAFH